MVEETEPLVGQLMTGDESGLLELFEQHRDKLRRIIRVRMDRRIQSRVSDSDVLQDAYIDLVKQLPNYVKDPRLPVFLWMRRITCQVLGKIQQHHLEREKRNAKRDVPLVHVPDPGASSAAVAVELVAQMTSVATKAASIELLERIDKTLSSMSENDREIIALRHGEQLSNEEVAHVLGLTPAGASKRYARAILRVQKELEGIPGLFDCV